jgi:hypothetical protein
MTEQVWRGVWLSDRPLDSDEGACGDVVLFIEIPEEIIAEYEWIQDMGYREFLVPAEIVDRFPIRQCHICDECSTEYGGTECWWCRARHLTGGWASS